MSWDVMIIRVAEGSAEVAEESDVPLGARADVLDALRSTFPEIDLTDPTWGTIEGDDYSIEFNLGHGDPCVSFMLHVRGTEDAIEPIRRLCANTGWSAFDTTTGEIMDFDDDPADGLRQWRAFRDQISPGGPEKGVRISLNRKRWWQFWK